MDGFAGYFQSLVGKWTVARTISDGSAFKGDAVFERKTGKQLLLTESGTLELATGASVFATRAWVWHLVSGMVLDINYDETPLRPYHHLKIEPEGAGLWQAAASHLCGDDTYDGHYTFSDGRIVVDHTVRGPKKDYSMRTVYLA